VIDAESATGSQEPRASTILAPESDSTNTYWSASLLRSAATALANRTLGGAILGVDAELGADRDDGSRGDAREDGWSDSAGAVQPASTASIMASGATDTRFTRGDYRGTVEPATDYA
jgi:hypothetical protein